MVDGVNNSTGVLAALRHLQTANKELSTSEARVSSGLRITGAKDGAAAFQSSQSMQGEQGSLKAVSLSLSHAKSVSDTAITAAEQISKLLQSMRDTAVAAMSADLSQQQRDTFDTTFQEQKTQLAQFIASASFDNANLLDGTKPNGVTFIADADATQVLTLQGRDFRMGNSVIPMSLSQDLTTPTNAAGAYAMLTQSMTNVGAQLTQMSSESKRVDAQIGFVSKLADALAGGVGRLVDADLASESALVQALQVKQQLSAQSISIVNNAPQSLLALFGPRTPI